MKYLPFEDFEIHTQLTSDEVFYRLRAAVETNETWFLLLLFNNKSYFGNVGRNNFRISRVTWWNNFVNVFGEIQPKDFGCHIRISIRMPWLGLLLSLFWLGTVWYSFWRGIANLMVGKIQMGIWQIESLWGLLPPVVMFVFGYLIFVGTFKSEANLIKKFLLHLSNANEKTIVNRDRILGVTEPQIIKSLFLLTFIVLLGWMIYNFLR
jgi:hypothetical protein